MGNLQLHVGETTGELSGIVKDGGAWLKSGSTDWVMVCLISTGFPWLSDFAGPLKQYSVFRDPVYRADPQSSRPGQASLQFGHQWLSLRLSSQNHLYCGSSFLHMHNQGQTTVAEQCKSVAEERKNDRWNPKFHFNQIRLIRSCCGFVDN